MSNEDFEAAERIRQQLSNKAKPTDPFRTSSTQTDKSKETTRKFVPGRGTTPGQLVDPFRRQSKSRGQKKTFPMSMGEKHPKPGASNTAGSVKIHKPKIYADPGPYWWFVAKEEIAAAKEKGITEEWIKQVAPLVKTLLVYVPPSVKITSEEVELAILLVDKDNLKMIVETEAATFDPVRNYNKTFSQHTKKQRQAFWIKLAQDLLEKF